MEGLALMTLGTTARKVEVYAPGDPSLECMRYPCRKGSIDIAIASVSMPGCPWRYQQYREPIPHSISFGPVLMSSTVTKPVQADYPFQGHKAFRHPSSCRKLPLGRSTTWV